MPAPPQTIPSSYNWGQLFDLQRRLGAASVATSAADQLQICQSVSSLAYSWYPWIFTLAQSPLGSIQAVNMVQDYPMPSDLYRLTRAWFYVPNGLVIDGSGDGTIPPYDDPSQFALVAAELSAAYVGTTGGGSPAATIWPSSGSFDIATRLAPNLYPRAYTQIRSICKQPNQALLRLDSALAVSSSCPFSLELEYQPVRHPVNALTEPCWFPDDYMRIAQEGILYWLYRFNNDPRTGSVAYSQGGVPTYSGQLAVWYAAMNSAAQADREGSVNFITPTGSLGSDYGNTGGWWIA